MKNRKQKIIELVVVNILWSIFIFGAVFFITWSTDLSTLDWSGRFLIVFLILAGIIFSVLDFIEKTESQESNKYPVWFVTAEQAEKLRELNFEDFEIVINPQAEELYKDKEEEVAFLKKHLLKDIYNYEQILEWFRKQQYIGIVKYRKNKSFSYEILGLRKTISYFYNTYEEAREALIREMINIYKIKNLKNEK